MPKTKYDFGITQECSFRCQVKYVNPDLTPVNITGFTGHVKFWRPGTAVPAFYGDTTNGKLYVKGSLGIVEFVLSSAETAALDLGAYFYEVRIVAPTTAETTQLVSGKVTINDI